jgi:hypothetical protein
MMRHRRKHAVAGGNDPLPSNFTDDEEESQETAGKQLASSPASTSKVLRQHLLSAAILRTARFPVSSLFYRRNIVFMSCKQISQAKTNLRALYALCKLFYLGIKLAVVSV